MISEFDFSNWKRNQRLEEAMAVTGRIRKTGTTIAACVFDGGVVLGADTRATEGDIVADKFCQKIHYIADNIYVCGAGTAADNDFVTRKCSAAMKLLEMDLGRPVRVATAVTHLKRELFYYGGYIGAYLIVGGVDALGPSLVSIDAHGSSSKNPYTTLGSGSIAAMSVFERDYRPKLSREEAMNLVREAIYAGIMNDLGSGSVVDLCSISLTGFGTNFGFDVEYLRPHFEAVRKGDRLLSYSYPSGTTPLLSRTITPLTNDLVDTAVRPVLTAEAIMETD